MSEVIEQLRNISGKQGVETATQKSIEFAQTRLNRLQVDENAKTQAVKDVLNSNFSSDIPEMVNSFHQFILMFGKREELDVRGAFSTKFNTLDLKFGDDTHINPHRSTTNPYIELVIGNDILKQSPEIQRLRFVHEMKHCEDMKNGDKMETPEQKIEAEKRATAAEMAAYIELNRNEGFKHGGYDILIDAMKQLGTEKVITAMATLHVKHPNMETHEMYEQIMADKNI